MECVAGEHNRAGLLQLQLHRHGASRVSRAVMEGDSLEDLELLAGEGLPPQSVNGELLLCVGGAFYARGIAPESVFQLFVAPDFDV